MKKLHIFCGVPAQLAPSISSFKSLKRKQLTDRTTLQTLRKLLYTPSLQKLWPSIMQVSIAPQNPIPKRFNQLKEPSVSTLFDARLEILVYRHRHNCFMMFVLLNRRQLLLIYSTVEKFGVFIFFERNTFIW